MSDLQLGLLVVGVLAVVGVLLYNRLQERTAGRLAGEARGAGRGDALPGADEQRREPTFGHLQGRPRRAAAAQGGEPLPDARLDYIIELTAQSAVSPVALLEVLERRFAGRVLLAAATAPPAEGWRAVGPGEGAPARRLRAGLQLVTRAGRIGEAELIEFRSLVETFCAKLGATVSAPEMKPALEVARELDQLCAQTDIEIALHVTAPAANAPAGGTALAAARAQGLEAQDDGRLVHRDHDGRVLYTAIPPGAGTGDAQEFVLLMDVPRVIEPRRVYESMVRCARHLAGALGGEVRDDNGRVLDDGALAAIESELAAVRDALEQAGIAPGGPLALRLFS